MKSLFNKIVKWYNESNRQNHLLVGMITCSIFLIYGGVSGMDNTTNVINATMVTALAMATAEFKDKQHGGLFDWLDILAGMTYPILIDIVCLIIYLIIK